MNKLFSEPQKISGTKYQFENYEIFIEVIPFNSLFVCTFRNYFTNKIRGTILLYM